MEDELREAIEYWNDFVNAMIEARDAWEVVQERALEGLSTEEAPTAFQRAISMFGKAKFTIAVPRMIDWVRMYKTWEELLVPKEDEVPEEETFE